ncbi:MAG: hypothetical protein GY772_31385, partial [bacterium]|nr:hypothetical protein [bacterium]
MTRDSTDVQEVATWIDAPRGPGGAWQLDRCFPWNWRHWLAAMPEASFRSVMRGHGVKKFGLRPIVGTIDPLPQMRGPVWDFYVVLDCVPNVVVFLHPSQHGPLRKVTDACDEARALAGRRCARGGVSVKERALYPGGLAPRVNPQGPHWQELSVDPRNLFGGGGPEAKAPPSPSPSLVARAAALAADSGWPAAGPAAPWREAGGAAAGVELAAALEEGRAAAEVTASPASPWTPWTQVGACCVGPPTFLPAAALAADPSMFGRVLALSSAG